MSRKSILPSVSLKHATEHLRPPVDAARENTQNQTAYDNVVEMGDNEVGIMILESQQALTASMTPVTPPITKVGTNPTANRFAAVKWIDRPTS